MAARRTVLDFSKGFKRCFGTYQRLSKSRIGLNKTVFIVAPCTCFVAWHTWRKLSQMSNFVPEVSASETDSMAQVGRSFQFQQVPFFMHCAVKTLNCIY